MFDNSCSQKYVFIHSNVWANHTIGKQDVGIPRQNNTFYTNAAVNVYIEPSSLHNDSPLWQNSLLLEKMLPQDSSAFPTRPNMQLIGIGF